MEFFKIRKDIPFMRHALAFNVISIVTFLLAVYFLAIKGLNFGVDFTGGTVMEISYPQAADLPKIRGLLEQHGYADVTVQNFGSSHDVLIRLPAKAVVTGANSATLLLLRMLGRGRELGVRLVLEGVARAAGAGAGVEDTGTIAHGVISPTAGRSTG